MSLVDPGAAGMQNRPRNGAWTAWGARGCTSDRGGANGAVPLLELGSGARGGTVARGTFSTALAPAQVAYPSQPDGAGTGWALATVATCTRGMT